MIGPLKITTDYTLLQSLIKIPDLISFLLTQNIKVCGICDDNLGGSLEFYTACKLNNIKPVIGLHVEIDENSLYLYAKNYLGYQELIKINTCKEEETLDYNVLNNCHNIIVILPYASRKLASALKDEVYFGFTSELEKKELLKFTKQIVYVEDIRTLKEKEIPYTKYLDYLRNDEKNIKYNCYQNIDDPGVLEEVIVKLNVEIPTDKRYIPKYCDNSGDYLKSLANRGLYKRCGGKVLAKYQERLDYELDIIKKMGFVDYFLICYDYVLFAKKNKIMVGPGRGSAAGSLVSYVLGITDIDPIKYDLLFERFLNPQRVTMPDIDVDFDALKREEVINYVREKYGKERVALGLTYSTLKSRLVLRELGKIMKINPDLLNKFLKTIDGNLKLDKNLENEVVKQYLQNYEELKKLYVVAKHLEGIKKNTSIHAAGVVICSQDLDSVIPVMHNNDTLITGVPLDNLETYGILKMDFLALKNLTLLDKMKHLSHKENLIIDNLEEKKVYEMLAKGETTGIFQFETPILKNLTKKFQPTCFNDLVVLLALGRPGPIMFADSFIRRKNGLESVNYINEDLEKILKSTYGIILYQEQIMSILKVVAGYSYADADIIRRAISKKKADVIDREKEKFIKRAMENNYSREVATDIYEQMARFASYGFNKSHSVAYARIAYYMAYFKAFYPVYFVIAMLDEGISPDLFNAYMNFLKLQGVKIVKPDINFSEVNYYLKNEKLVMPLNTIKGITKELSQKIISQRQNKYIDIFDFVSKTDDFIDKKLLKILVDADAMRSL